MTEQNPADLSATEAGDVVRLWDERHPVTGHYYADEWLATRDAALIERAKRDGAREALEEAERVMENDVADFDEQVAFEFAKQHLRDLVARIPPEERP